MGAGLELALAEELDDFDETINEELRALLTNHRHVDTTKTKNWEVR